MELAQIQAIVAAVFAFALFIMAHQSWFTVHEGYLASLTSFGRALRETDGRLKIYKPGLYFKYPWHEKHELSIMEKKLNLGSEKFFEVLTYDGTQFSFEVYARVRANPAYLEKLLFDLDHPIQHIESYIKSIFRSAISSYGKHLEPGDSVLKLRKELPVLFTALKEKYHQTLLDKYGIEFTGLDVVEMQTPENLNAALNSVQTAQADAQYIIANAMAQREVLILSASENLKISRIEAEASRNKIEKTGNFISQLATHDLIVPYIQRRKSEIMYQSSLTIMNKEI